MCVCAKRRRRRRRRSHKRKPVEPSGKAGKKKWLRCCTSDLSLLPSLHKLLLPFPPPNTPLFFAKTHTNIASPPRKKPLMLGVEEEEEEEKEEEEEEEEERQI